MDAHRLNFQEKTFDLIYSYTSAHFWWNPATILAESKRVSKPGAWIITAGIRDYGSIPYYPYRPLLNQVWRSLGRYMDVRKQAYASGDRNPKGYWDFHAARKCVDWYIKAKIRVIQIESWVEDWWYLSSPRDEAIVDAMTLEFYRELIEDAVTVGFLDPKIAESAFQERREWIQVSYAFSYHPLVTIYGRA
jgi:SAM-dependent methyltransferase